MRSQSPKNVIMLEQNNNNIYYTIFYGTDCNKISLRDIFLIYYFDPETSPNFLGL